jgi:tetratricopeptide (TPR) repeat protein
VTFDDDGSRAVVPRERVPADVRYALELARHQPRDAEDWRALADRAQQLQLPVRRMEALTRAQDLSPTPETEAELSRARQACGQALLQRARELQQQGEDGMARRRLRTLLDTCAPSPAADEGRQLLAQVEEDIADRRDRAPPEPARRSGDADEGPLADAAALLHQGQRSLEQGLQQSDDYAAAKDAFQEALDRFQEARRILRPPDNETEREHAGREDTEPTSVTPQGSTQGRRMLEKVRDKLVRAHLELGNVDVSLGALPDASRHAGLAAALDPGDPAVGRLRQSIAARRSASPPRGSTSEDRG